jgi:predicted transposase YdaD
MAKAFDATLKQLLDTFAADWLTWLGPRIGLPADVAVDPLDVDLSTVQYAADKVFRLLPPANGLLHIEPQSSWDGDLADRIHVYSTLLYERYKVPIYSVLLLLRKDANSPNLTGILTRAYDDGHCYLRFEYGVIRVWELPCEPLLESGPGTAPLALLTDEAEGQLRKIVTLIDQRMRSEKASQKTRKLVLTSGFILLGLRYNEDEIRDAFLGVQGMKESTTYQAILREGREEERLAARRETLLAVLEERFPEVPSDVRTRIEKFQDLAELQAAIRRAVRMTQIEDLGI